MPGLHPAFSFFRNGLLSKGLDLQVSANRIARSANTYSDRVGPTTKGRQIGADHGHMTWQIVDCFILET